MVREENARATARASYERGRLHRGLELALPALMLAGVAVLLHEGSLATASVGAVLVLATVFAGHYGRGLDRLVGPATISGLPAFIAPLCITTEAHLCAGDWCLSYCLTACVAGGLVSGLLFAGRLRRIAPGPALFGSGLLLLVGMLGCIAAGVPGVIGLIVGGAVGGVPRLFLSPSSGPS